MKVIVSNEIVNLTTDYPIFFRPGYIKYQQKIGNSYFLIQDEDTGAIMPLKVRKRAIFKIGQYMFRPLLNGNYLTAEEESRFLEKFTIFCDAEKVADFVLPQTHHFSNFGSLPLKCSYRKMSVIVLDLERNEDDIFSSFSSSYRTQIRKAIKGGVKIFFDNTRFAEFYELYKNVHKKQGIYFDSKADLELMLDCIGQQNYFLAFASMDNAPPSCAILVLYSGKHSIYYHGGTVDDIEFQGTNKLLQYEAMKKLKSLGAEKYYLGGFRSGNITGTKYEGLQNFKMKFGSTLEEGYHFLTHAGVKYHLYRMAMSVYLLLKGVKENNSDIALKSK
jgi:hypothetical protein